MSDTMGIHATFITTVALRRVEYPDPIWTEARSASRGLLRQIFRADGKDVVESMLGMAVIATTERRRTRKMKAGKAVPPPVPVTRLHLASVRRELWKMTYDTLSSSDVDGVAVLIRSIASFAHIEKLDRHGSWSSKDLTEVITDEKWTSGIRAINNALQVSRENFPRIMESLALQPDISLLRGLWALEGVPKAAVILLLSPAEEIHIPVISLIQQSFDDVDDRGDCFRVLLEKYPSQAMDGLQDFLHSFILTAQQTPESCSLAKWLVRCFTDVLDALCQPSRSSDALLQSEEFLSAYDGTSMARRVAELWQLMTTGLAVIFKRTQDWAPYFENSVMVDWMRDALIFGRQMAEHIRSFEAAALGHSASRLADGGSESPVKMSSVGKKLVRGLDMVLKDLVSWLRLTE
jgi:senataxin